MVEIAKAPAPSPAVEAAAPVAPAPALAPAVEAVAPVAPAPAVAPAVEAAAPVAPAPAVEAAAPAVLSPGTSTRYTPSVSRSPSVVSASGDDTWVARFTNVKELWGSKKRRHWFNPTTGEVSFLNPKGPDFEHEVASTEFVPTSLQEMLAWLAYLEIGEMGTLMKVRTGKAIGFSNPKLDNFDYSEKKYWFYLDWIDPISDWRLVYSQSEVVYKDIPVSDELVEGSEIMLHVLSPVAAVCKQVLITEVGNIYLEPEPNDRSFRVYLNTANCGEENVIQITAPDADEAVAWVEGILFAKAIQVTHNKPHPHVINQSTRH